MLSPNGSAIGDLWGSPQDAVRNIAYWRLRAADGAAWLDAKRGRVRNRIVPGFEPHGYGAETTGNYRSPLFVERVAGFVAAMHEEGALVTSPLTVIGGVPHALGQQLGSPLSNSRPHVMTRDDIGWYVEEYAYSAGPVHAAPAVRLRGQPARLERGGRSVGTCGPAALAAGRRRRPGRDGTRRARRAQRSWRRAVGDGRRARRAVARRAGRGQPRSVRATSTDRPASSTGTASRSS